MGDRERVGGVSPTSPLNGSTTSLPSSGVSHALLEEERWLLGQGLTHGELRDELYCQVMKQLNGNPNTYVKIVVSLFRATKADYMRIEKASFVDGSCSACSSSLSLPRRTSKHTSARGFSRPPTSRRDVWMSWRSTAYVDWRISPRKAREANLPVPQRSKPHR